MCLDYINLQVRKDNDEIKVGYKLFLKRKMKGKNCYFNPYFEKLTPHYLGEWVENESNILVETYEYRSGNERKYKAGFHFYDDYSQRLAHIRKYSKVVVECICENITATGKQNRQEAFVAQSYRLMREV